MNAPRLLWPAALGLTALGLALRLAPAAPPAASAPVVSSAPSLPPVPAPPSGAEVVAGNIFTASRSAPRLRFSPRGLVPTAAAPVPAPLVLYGITLTARDALALIDADPRVPGAEIYRIGERVRGNRIVAITDSTVTLTPASGTAPFVLRLPTSVRRQP